MHERGANALSSCFGNGHDRLEARKVTARENTKARSQSVANVRTELFALTTLDSASITGQPFPDKGIVSHFGKVFAAQ